MCVDAMYARVHVNNNNNNNNGPDETAAARSPKWYFAKGNAADGVCGTHVARAYPVPVFSLVFPRTNEWRDLVLTIL